MLASIIIVVVIILVMIVGIQSFRGTLKHGCCGAGGGTEEIKAEDKQLDGPVVAEKDIQIEGMTCINCQNRIQRRLNKIDGVSAEVNFKTGRAHVKMDRQVPDNTLRTAITQLDYKVISIQ